MTKKQKKLSFSTEWKYHSHLGSLIMMSDVNRVVSKKPQKLHLDTSHWWLTMYTLFQGSEARVSAVKVGNTSYHLKSLFYHDKIWKSHLKSKLSLNLNP